MIEARVFKLEIVWPYTDALRLTDLPVSLAIAWALNHAHLTTDPKHFRTHHLTATVTA